MTDALPREQDSFPLWIFSHLLHSRVSHRVGSVCASSSTFWSGCLGSFYRPSSIGGSRRWRSRELKDFQKHASCINPSVLEWSDSPTFLRGSTKLQGILVSSCSARSTGSYSFWWLWCFWDSLFTSSSWSTDSPIPPMNPSEPSQKWWRSNPHSGRCVWFPLWW